MRFTLGIRREDKNKWEARVPIIPEYVKKLWEKYNIKTIIQPSKIRTFSDEEYANVGAIVQEDISDCPIILPDSKKSIGISLTAKIIGQSEISS